MSRLILGCVLALAFATPAPAAFAAPAIEYDEPGQWGATIPEVIDDVPLEGVIVLRAVYGFGADDYGPVASIQVRDAADTEVPGVITAWRDIQCLVWVSDAPLAPSTTYTAEVELWGGNGDLQESGVIVVTTSEEAALPATAPSVDAVPSLGEAFGPCTDCATARLRIMYNASGDPPYLFTEVEWGHPGGVTVPVPKVPGSIADETSWSWQDEIPPVCVTVSSISLIDGSRDSVEVCGNTEDYVGLLGDGQELCEGDEPVTCGGCAGAPTRGVDWLALLLLSAIWLGRGRHRRSRHADAHPGHPHTP